MVEVLEKMNYKKDKRTLLIRPEPVNISYFWNFGILVIIYIYLHIQGLPVVDILSRIYINIIERLVKGVDFKYQKRSPLKIIVGDYQNLKLKYKIRWE